MGPKRQAPTGALPPASARVRVTGGPIGTADTAPPTAPRTTLVPPTKTAPPAPPAPPTETAQPTAHYQYTVDLNYKLTKEVAQLKKDLTTQQQDHDRRTADLLAQIATKTQELATKTQEVKTYSKAREDLHDYYQERKKYWTKQHEDDQKKIDSLTETIKIVVTTRAHAP